MDQEIRNKLRNVVTQCRKLLEDSIAQELEGKYGIFSKRDQVTADPNAKMAHLSEEEQAARKDILDHFGHINARGFKPKDSLDQLVREIAFTHLNRLCAYKMMEAREVYVGGQKFREAVSRGVNSNGVKFYLADHEEDERLFNTGHQDVAYRHYLDWLGGALSDEIGVLFNPNDPANRLYPRQKTLDEVLELLNEGGIKAEETELREQWPKIWSQDETIGWVYQYFTPKELRDQARKESQAPRNSYELAFRNQFFTPRYVVEFLTDNTLGRIWYEMRKGATKLKDQCRYMLRRPTEIFLKEGEQLPKDVAEGEDDLSQEELLKLPVHIPHRPKKDPRELKILDPACGSGHFLLYCFDLLLTIYEEAYADPDLGPALKKDYPTLDALKRDVPRLILAHNLHGIDIDLRASQIAALALWLRCQRAYQDMGLKKDRPKITRSNFVCAEPMPGEEQMLKEFVRQLEPKVLGQVVEVVFDKMKLAGEAGSLLKIEEEIRDAIREAKRQYAIGGISVQRTLFDKPTEPVVKVFSVKDITDEQFFEGAESQVIEALRSYAEKAQNGQRLQRRLFTEDAVRGFAFVDLCQKRYDVVLMNPPFGLASDTSSEFVKASYLDSFYDLSATFLDRSTQFAGMNGLVGIIANRTIFYSARLGRYRHSLLSTYVAPSFIDLGSGVLDALVETSLFVTHKRPPNDKSVTVAVNISRSTDKADSLQASVGTRSVSIIAKWQSDLLSGNTEFDFSRKIGSVSLKPFAECDYEVRQGLATGDNFRFLRLQWEVPHTLLSYRWRTYSKGGDFAPFFYSLHLVIDWSDEAQQCYCGNTTVFSCLVTKNKDKYALRPGLTYSTRTTAPVSFRVLPAGSIFDTKGSAVFSDSVRAPGDDPERLLWAACFLNCVTTQNTIDGKAVAGDGAARSYGEGLISAVPSPLTRPVDVIRFVTQVQEVIRSLKKVYSYDETSAFFQTVIDDDRDALAVFTAMQNDLRRRVDDEVNALRTSIELAQICIDMRDPNVASEVIQSVATRHGYRKHEALSEIDTKWTAHAVASYCVGCSFGRWNLSARYTPGVDNPFSEFPATSPGMVTDVTDDPASDHQVAHSDVISASGILSDELGSSHDIVAHVRKVFEVIWKDRADAIEKESCDILGVKELREYFRKLGKGGFWDEHISRYSKSRRKAPIYWLLQSSKKNYALWLYYHRLDKDLLFKALVNYVEPKIRLETSLFETLTSQKATAGDSGKEAKRSAKEVERQEEFLSELRDFEDKLRRAANLHLEPDLNDGVVLNIAPLHELVPWKEAKNYWQELLKGKYEWSSIGKQLRQKGLVK